MATSPGDTVTTYTALTREHVISTAGAGETVFVLPPDKTLADSNAVYTSTPTKTTIVGGGPALANMQFQVGVYDATKGEFTSLHPDLPDKAVVAPTSVTSGWVGARALVPPNGQLDAEFPLQPAVQCAVASAAGACAKQVRKSLMQVVRSGSVPTDPAAVAALQRLGHPVDLEGARALATQIGKKPAPSPQLHPAVRFGGMVNPAATPLTVGTTFTAHPGRTIRAAPHLTSGAVQGNGDDSSDDNSDGSSSSGSDDDDDGAGRATSGAVRKKKGKGKGKGGKGKGKRHAEDHEDEDDNDDDS